MNMIDVTLVKIIGEVDNNNCKIEYFRVYKVETLLMEPQVNTKIILVNGESFFIHSIDQNLQKMVIYLHEYTWISRYKYRGNHDDFDKLKQEFVSTGWSDTDKHKIIRGGV